MVSSHVYQFHNQSKQSTKASTKQRIKQTDRTGPDHPLSPAVSLCELACCLTDSRPGRCIRRRANKKKKIAAAHDLRVEPALFGLLCVPPAAGFTSSESERSQERGGSSMALHPRSSAFFIQATKQRFQPHAAALPAYPIDVLPRGLLFGSIAYTRRRLQLAFPSSGLGRVVVQLGPAGQGRQARSTSHKRDAPPVAIYWDRRATAACRWGSGRLCYGGGAAKTSAALPTIIMRERDHQQPEATKGAAARPFPVGFARRPTHHTHHSRLEDD